MNVITAIPTQKCWLIVISSAMVAIVSGLVAVVSRAISG